MSETKSISSAEISWLEKISYSSDHYFICIKPKSQQIINSFFYHQSINELIFHYWNSIITLVKIQKD